MRSILNSFKGLCRGLYKGGVLIGVIIYNVDTTLNPKPRSLDHGSYHPKPHPSVPKMAGPMAVPDAAQIAGFRV